MPLCLSIHFAHFLCDDGNQFRVSNVASHLRAHEHEVQHGGDGGTLAMLGDIEPWPKEHHPDMMAYSLAHVN